jgi:hypothetical protein
VRVATLVLLGLVIIVVGFGVHLLLKWSEGFGPAQTPAEAMEKFREAVQKRRYHAAAGYCTGEYADVLVKGSDGAARLGKVIDAIRTYMTNKELQTDRALVLLHSLDPFPGNFRIDGTVRQASDREAHGVFTWEPLPVKSSNVSWSSEATSLD